MQIRSTEMKKNIKSDEQALAPGVGGVSEDAGSYGKNQTNFAM